MKTMLSVGTVMGFVLLLFASSAGAAIDILDTCYDQASSDMALASGWVGGRHSDDTVITHTFISNASGVKPFAGKNYSLQIDYDTSKGYGWFFDGLASDWGNVDTSLTGYNYLSFWVRGNAGGEGFQVGLGNSSYVESRMQVNQFLPNGITTQWQKVVIPLSVLEASSPITRGVVSKFVIAVDGTALNGAAQGTVYIDNITFGKSTAPVWVSNYDHGDVQADGTTLTATRGGVAVYNGTETFNSTYFQSAPYSLGCNAGPGGTLAHFLKNYDGITAPTTTVYADISGCDAAQFGIRGAVGGENPSIRVMDKNWNALSNPLQTIGINPTTSFQTVTVPFAALGGSADLHNMAECDFDISANMQFYLDNLRFVDTSAPAKPTNMNIAQGAIIATQVQTVALSVDASSVNGDAKMERVLWEYSANNGVSWNAIDTVYATSDAQIAFPATWDISGLANAAYKLRATAYHVGETASVSLTHDVTLAFGTPTNTPTVTSTPTISETPTESVTFTVTPTVTPTASISATLTISATVTMSPTFTPTPTVSASPTISATPSVTAVLTATYTATPFSQEVRLLRNALNPAKGESVPLDIRMPTRGKLRVTVYSRLGDKIVELINQDAGPGIIENLAWDGKNASHNIVASGIYVIYVEAADQKVKRLIAVIK
jgi:hypothetical protein